MVDYIINNRLRFEVAIWQKGTAHTIEQNCLDILKRREEWFDGQLDLDPEPLIFIDETWA